MSQLFQLSQYGRLVLEGNKAVDLLHGQCSAEVRKMNPGQHIFTSINNIKGRTLATFLLWCDRADRFYLETLKDNLPTLQTILAKYSPLYRCQVLEDESLGYLALNPENKPHNPVRYQHGWLRFWQEQALPAEPLTQSWLACDLKRGWIFLSAAQSEQYIPLWLGLDLTDGISFTKGCYTGQEVIARLHYRGKAKQRPTLAEGPSSTIEHLQQPELGQLIAYDLASSPACALWLQRAEQQGQTPKGWQIINFQDSEKPHDG